MVNSANPDQIAALVRNSLIGVCIIYLDMPVIIRVNTVTDGKYSSKPGLYFSVQQSDIF